MSKINQWRKAESGFTTVAIFILSLPLIIGLFGYGFDSARSVYFRNYIQGRADIAVAAGVAQTTVDASGNLVLSNNATSSATATAVQYYLDNTRNMRTENGGGALTCQEGYLGQSGQSGTLSSIGGHPTSGSGDQAGCVGGATITNNSINSGNTCAAGTKSAYGVHYTATEKISTTFLGILGIHELTLSPVEAEASLVSAGC
jgi:hypothetical protein